MNIHTHTHTPTHAHTHTYTHIQTQTHTHTHPPLSPDSQIDPAWPENATGNIGDAPGHVASAATVSLLTCLLPPY